MGLTFTIRSNAALVARQLAERAPAELIGAVVRAMDHANAGTVALIQRDKLTAAGPRYLNVRTGRLRRSARATDARVEGTRIVSEIGSNVKYAAVHEFGYRGTERIRGFVRRIQSRNLTGKVDGKRRRTASGVAFVRSHTRRVFFPARRMFRDALEERREDYRNELSASVIRAWAAL